MNSSISIDASCGFAGNSDIYGVGIRVGYYTQALAVYFSNIFLFSEAKSLRAVNSLFLLALSIVTVIYAYNGASTHAIEVFILLQTGLCLGLVSIMEGTRYSCKYIRTNKEALIIRTVLMNFGLLYNLYFWWWGLDSMEQTPCGTYVFYVVRADIYGPTRTAMKIFAIIGLVWRTLFTTAWDVGAAIRDLKLRKARALFAELAEQWQEHTLKVKPAECKNVAVQTDFSSNIPVVQDIECGRGKENTTTRVAIDRQLFEQHKGPDLDLCIPTIPIASAHSGTNSSKSHCAELGFESIREAEKYLNDIFAPKLLEPGPFGQCSPLNHSSATPRDHKAEHSSPLLDQSSYRASLYWMIKATWADQNTRGIKDTLSIHSKALNLKISYWPRTVDRMLSLNIKQGPPSWQAVAIASDIQLTQMPVFKPLRIWVFLGAQNLLVVVLLIVQIELTIAWNRLHDLQGLSTVGQLFPLILGVGGLAKIFWEKGCHLWKGMRSRDLKEERKRLGQYERAMEQYLDWKTQQLAVTTQRGDRAKVNKSN